MQRAASLLLCAVMAAMPVTASTASPQADSPAQALSPAQQEAAARERQQHQLLQLQMGIESLLERTGDLTQIVPATYNELHSQKDHIELALAGQKVREHAIQKKIDELTRQGQELIDKDPIIAGLQKIADQKQKDAERLQELVQQKLASVADGDAAVSRAAEALVHIQERKEAITAAVGGGILPSLTKDLISVSLDIAQQEATLQALNDRLIRVEKARDLYREWWSVAHEPIPASQPAGR